MLKKAIVLISPLAAAAAIAMVPVSASGDVFLKCPPGVTNHTYCEKYGQRFEKCVIPNVEGLSVKDAREKLRKHDCTIERIRDQDARNAHRGNRGDRDDNVVRTEPPAHTVHRDNFGVTLFVD